MPNQCIYNALGEETIDVRGKKRVLSDTK